MYTGSTNFPKTSLVLDKIDLKIIRREIEEYTMGVNNDGGCSHLNDKFSELMDTTRGLINHISKVAKYEKRKRCGDKLDEEGEHMRRRIA